MTSASNTRKPVWGCGLRATGRSSNASLWSIRSVLATVEPFIDVAAEPGKEFTWKYTYDYYALREAIRPGEAIN